MRVDVDTSEVVRCLISNIWSGVTTNLKGEFMVGVEGFMDLSLHVFRCGGLEPEMSYRVNN